MNKSRQTCINCGGTSHVYKNCSQPTTSFGIVAYRVDPARTGTGSASTNRRSEGLQSPKRRCHRHRRVEDCPDHLVAGEHSDHSLLFLMVQRKDTMAYTDLVRGVYPSMQPERGNILATFASELTCEEREKLLMCPFQSIWDDLWLNHGRSHVSEYAAARAKFEQIDIRKLFEDVPCAWTQQEFGFPKGRKNMNEGNRQCAIREFCEESGYRPNELTFVTDESFEERFRGTNNKDYRHVYYIAKVNNDATGPRFDPGNMQQVAEIRKISWLTYEQCLSIMRPYDAAKRETFERIHDSLVDHCCRKYF